MYKLQKQILDLQYHSEEQARNFQDHARHLYYGRIVPAMESILKKYDAEDSLFRINHMELDLGTLYENEFDSEWVRKFSIAFEEELKRRLHLIQNQQAGSEDSHMPVHRKKTEIFEYYLLQGALPWNSDDDKSTPALMADELMRLYTSDFIRILKKHGSNEKVIRRLVYQLSERQITRIIELVQPTEAKFIIETVEKVDVTRRRESFVKTDSVYFRQQLWELVLSYILEDRGSYFNTREFVRSTLFGIADHFNMERSLLIIQFYHAVQLLEKGIYFSIGLRQIIYDIYFEIRENEKEPDTIPQTDTPGTNTSDAAPPFEAGQLPAGNLQNIQQLLQQWIYDPVYAASVRDWLFAWGDDAAFRRRLSDSIRHKNQFRQLVQIIDAPNAGYRHNFSEELQRRQEERQILPVTAGVFRKDRYYVILTVLLSNRGSYFNKKSFVRQVLQQLASLYNTSYQLLLNLLVMAIPTQLEGMSRMPEIVQILKELQEESMQEAGAKQKKTSLASLPGELLLQALQYMAYHNKAPLWLQRQLPGIPLTAEGLWTALLHKMPGIKEKAGRFLLQHAHVQMLLQHIPEKLYRQTLQQFLPPAQEQYIQQLEQLNSSVLKALGKTTGTVFLKQQQAFILQHAWMLSARHISPREFAVAALHFFARLSQSTPALYLQHSIQVLQHAGNEPALRMQKTLQTLLPGYQNIPASNSESTLPDDAPEGLITLFLNKYASLPYTAPLFRHELTLLIKKLEINGATESIHRLLKRLFSRRTLQEFLAAEPAPLLQVLASLPMQEHRHFITGMLADLKLLMQKSGMQYSHMEKHIWQGLVLAWYSGMHTEKAFVQQVLLSMSKGSTSLAIQQHTQLASAAQELRGQLSGKTAMYLLQNTAKNNTAGTTQEKLVIPFLSEKESRVLDSYQVENAGLILLWPFMNMFFSRLEMLDGATFKDSTHAERAVHLLQYMASGSGENGEFALSLPKVLCGMLPSDPVPGNIEISNAEKELAESLLGAVIQQWSVLKNSSISTLRETFLCRSGILQRKEDSWELHVQGKAFDVLLDQLPWGLQIVKLPWMQNTLFSKWR